MVGLTDGKNFEDMYNRLHSITACDGQTDRQTSCHGIVRAMHDTRRAVKTKTMLYILQNGKTKSNNSIINSDKSVCINHTCNF